METEKIIFKNDKIKIFWHAGNVPNGNAKGLKVVCKAKNKIDKKEYEKYAGYLSPTFYLHRGTSTPSYIFENAKESIQENKQEILKSIIIFLKSIEKNYRASEFCTLSK